jgi:hypothetical protein
MALTVVPFYTIQSPVGLGSGFGTDVMLVQYMLFHVCVQPIPFFGRNLGLFGPTAPAVGPAAIFAFTGVYTPELDQWILTFQQTANQRGFGPLTEDGQINPAPVGWGQKPHVSGAHWYTIQALNLLMYQRYERPYTELPTFSDVPAALAKDLTLVMLPDSFSSS